MIDKVFEKKCKYLGPMIILLNLKLWQYTSVLVTDERLVKSNIGQPSKMILTDLYTFSPLHKCGQLDLISSSGVDGDPVREL